MECVIALGMAAHAAWQTWKETDSGKNFNITFAAVTHPTQPESSSKGDKQKLADATKKLHENWNAALQILSPAVKHPDAATPLVLYGDSWAAGDRPAIPEGDLPAVCLPGCMRMMAGQRAWGRTRKPNAATSLSRCRRESSTDVAALAVRLALATPCKNASPSRSPS